MSNIKSFPNNQNEYVGAEHVMRWLHGRTSGVFGADGNAAVAPVLDAMAVTVSDGNGWISNDNADGVVWWIDNEYASGSKLFLPVDMADAVLPRIDRVVVSWQTTNYVALPEVSILKGVPATYPVPPTLTNNNVLRQISLAAIHIPAGTTAITSVMITDERLNPEVCGIVSERVTADTSMVNAQYLAAVEELRTAIKQAWDGEIPNGSITQEMLDPNIKLGSNDIYIGTEEPTGEDRPKMWVDPNGGMLTPEQIGAMSMELLWENASPKSNFGAQTIGVPLGKFDEIVIDFEATTSDAMPFSVKIDFNNTAETHTAFHTRFSPSGTAFHIVARPFTTNFTGGSIAFGEGQQLVNTGSANTVETSRNDRAIPIAIYGVKGGI